MTASPRRRLVVLVGLLLVAVGLLVWFGSLPPDPEAGAYPSVNDLDGDADRYVGERVVVGGIVVDGEPVRIVVDPDVGEPYRLTVVGADVDVSPGDQLRVFGVLEGDGELRALNAVVVPPWGPLYAIGISALGVGWVLGRIVRYWRVDDWALERRPEPLSIPVSDDDPAADAASGDGGGDEDA